MNEFRIYLSERLWRTKQRLWSGEARLPPTHCPGPVLSPYLLLCVPPVLPEVEPCLGKRIFCPKMMSGAVLDLANLTPHLSPAPNTVGKHFLLRKGQLGTSCT